jgi:tetratricopeptide (TPR) repeat protein
MIPATRQFFSSGLEKIAEVEGCPRLRGNALTPRAARQVGADRWGRAPSPWQSTLDVKVAMNTPSALRNSDRRFLRAVGRWYSWAGLVVTVFCSYLALTGQLKLTDATQLCAAPQQSEQEPSWKPARTNWDIKEVSAPPTSSADDPFRAVSGATPLPPDSLPPVMSAPADQSQGPANPRTRAVLDAYTNGKPLVPAAHDDQPAAEGPKVPQRPKPAEGEWSAVSPSESGPTLPRTAEATAAPGGAPTTLPDPVPPARPLETSAMQGEVIPSAPTQLKKDGAPEEGPEPTSDDELLLYRARIAVKQNRFRDAVEFFERYLERKPKDIAVREELAGVLITAGDLPRAIQQLEQLVAARPTDVPLRVRLGDAYVIAKQYRPAINQFLSALEMTPDTPENRSSRLELATRLARTYAFDSDMVRANQVFDRYLARIRPEDPAAPRAMGALLLDLERAADALPYLMVQRQRQKDNPGLLVEVLASIVRAFSRLGERERAVEVLNEMASVEPRNINVRVILAETLFDTEDYELAGQVYNQILQVEPTNGSALVGMARVHLALYQPALARKILDSFVPNAAVQRGYLLTYAAYHERVGEYTEAKQIYRDMLRRDPTDHRIRLSLGLLYDYVREWDKAKAEFSKVPPSGGLGRRARLEYANTLANQRKFAEAIEIDRVLLTEDPTDATAVAQMVRHLGLTHAYDQAESLARGYLASNPRSEWMALTVRLALGRVLLDANKNLEAAREYEIALARPLGRIPVAYYGLARASERLGNGERAAQLIACVTANNTGSIRNHILLADLYYADYQDQRAVELLSMLARTEPGNLAVLTRLADAQQRLARLAGQPAAAFDTAISILTMSPTNVRGHLVMARSFGVAQNYRKASVQYNQLIAIDPEFTVAGRERARVLYSDKQYSAARSQYDALQTPPPDVVLQADIVGLIAKEPKLRPLLEPYTIAPLPGNAVRRELPRIQATLGHDPESQLALQRILNDYDARVAEQTAFKMEEDAKEQKDLRPYQGIFAYNQINTYEPTNTETLFDAGQNYAKLRMTHEAIKMYGATLDVDPTSRDAMATIDRAKADMSPKMDAGYDFFHQHGRDGLAQIDRHRWYVSGSVPLGDEDEYFRAGYARVIYNPTDDRSDPGNIPYLRAQKKFDANRLLLYGQLNVEDFRYGFDARPTFDAGFRYDNSDCTHTRGGLYLENVAENGEAIRQDIFRYGVYGGLDYTPSRFWTLGGLYRYAHYSDQNDASFFNIFSDLSLTLPPKQIKVVFDYWFWGFRESSIFPTNPPNPNFVFGTVHPYFSPNAFSQLFARIEWWQWLSRDYIAHTNQCYYSVQYGVGFDDRGVIYHDVRGLLNYDCCSWLTVGAQTEALFSSAYKMVNAGAFMQIRFK